MKSRTGCSLRVLEVGAGSGATTRTALEALPREGIEYLFTDVSSTLVAVAQAKFSDSRLAFAVVDIERDFASQAPGDRRFDLVIAANVLHVAADLPQTLNNIRKLLVPGGVLLLVEGTQPHAWFDITFGVLDGWWKFSDSIRSDYPLLGRDQWSSALVAAGFERPGFLLPSTGGADQSVIVSQARPIPKESWLVLANDADAARLLADALGSRSCSCQTVGDEELEQSGGFGTVVDRFVDGVESLTGIVDLRPLQDDENTAPTAESLLRNARERCTGLLTIVQELSRRGGRLPNGLWIVDGGKRAVDGSEVARSLHESFTAGLVLSLSIEQPELNVRLLNVEPQVHAGKVDLLVDEILSNRGDDQIALSKDERHVARILPVKSNRLKSASIRSDGSYLVTGGVGRIGTRIAEWLIEKGAGRVILVGRSEPSEKSVARIEGWKRAGADVRFVAVNVADRSAVDKLIQSVNGADRPLRGVIHAAMVARPGLLANTGWTDVEAVLLPKTIGAWNLHEATRSAPLDFFVLFSSSASTIGIPGLGGYPSANAFLDALAHQRRSEGLPATSISWGIWEGTPFDSESGGDERPWGTIGFGAMPVAEGIRFLEQLLAEGIVHRTVASVDWKEYFQQFAGAVRPLLAELSAVPVGDARRENRPSNVDWRGQLQTLPQTGRRRRIVEFLQGELIRLLGLPEDAPPRSRIGFLELGIDSLMALELRTRLQSQLQLNPPIAATVLFDYPTTDALADCLLDRLGFSEVAVVEPHANGNGDQIKQAVDELTDAETVAQIAEELESYFREAGDEQA